MCYQHRTCQICKAMTVYDCNGMWRHKNYECPGKTTCEICYEIKPMEDVILTEIIWKDATFNGLPFRVQSSRGKIECSTCRQKPAEERYRKNAIGGLETDTFVAKQKSEGKQIKEGYIPPLLLSMNEENNDDMPPV